MKSMALSEPNNPAPGKLEGLDRLNSHSHQKFRKYTAAAAWIHPLRSLLLLSPLNIHLSPWLIRIVKAGLLNFARSGNHNWLIKRIKQIGRFSESEQYPSMLACVLESRYTSIYIRLFGRTLSDDDFHLVESLLNMASTPTNTMVKVTRSENPPCGKVSLTTCATRYLKAEKLFLAEHA
jgi:hypothetical protein